MRRFLLALLCPSILAAQGSRISGVTTLQFIELRPLVIDSILATSVPGTGEWRTAPNGVPAVCPIGSRFCQYERSGNAISAGPIVQDVTFAGWGWVEGLSFHGELRARGQLGGLTGGFLFPRANDHLDVLDAYAQLDRADWQARVGRQFVINSFGAYGFDGANALWRHKALTLEGWSGRALVGGLDEPYTNSLLSAADNLPPQQNGYVFGARARVRPDALTAGVITYQRVLVADRSGLYSDRAAIDFTTRAYAAAIDVRLNYDLAVGDWNEARFRVGTNGMGPLAASIEARHSRPFFELWTIWGAFSPVAFDEARATVDWRPVHSQLSYSARGAYRKYADAGTATGMSLRTNGWRAGGDVRWQGAGTLSALGSYDIDIGSGAADTDVRAGARWSARPDVSFGADGMVTQNIYEFRIGTGRIYGASLDAAAQLRSDIQLVVEGGLYQHTLTNGAVGPDWTQKRASARVEWMLGRDPGLPVRSP